jgi:hypothetical protein
MEWIKTKFKSPNIWGCLAEVMIYNPNMKLDPMTTSGHFIGYAVNSKRFRFYCPSHSTKIIESINTKFLEDSEHSGSAYPQRIELEVA